MTSGGIDLVPRNQEIEGVNEGPMYKIILPFSTAATHWQTS